MQEVDVRSPSRILIEWVLDGTLKSGLEGTIYQIWTAERALD